MTKRVLILGDSHAHAIVAGFRTQRPDIEVFGNTIRVENGWDKPFHTGCAPLRFLQKEVQDSFQAHVQPAGFDGENLLDIDVPMVLSITGLPKLVRLPMWGRYFPMDTPNRYFLSRQLFEEMLYSYWGPVLDLYRCLGKAGKTVVCAIMPGLRANIIGRGDLFLEVKDFLAQELMAMGILIADVTDLTCDRHGILAEKYWVEDTEDHSHANEGWGQLVADACCRELKI